MLKSVLVLIFVASFASSVPVKKNTNVHRRVIREIELPPSGEGFRLAPSTPSCYENGKPISGAPFEKPGDCDHFYQCSNGRRYTMPCAPGTAFNPKIGVCDWPYNVPGCGALFPTTTLPTTTSKPLSFDTKCINATGYPISSAPFEKPGDCDHFYQCSNGYLYVMPCAPGTAFNPAIGVCDWPYKVPGCGRTTTTTEKVTTTTKATPKPFDPECLNATGYPISSAPFEKPGDCDNFYQCSNGYLHTMPCAPETAFNPAIGVCDWPYNVPGCEPSEGGGGGTPVPPTDGGPFDDLCLNATGYPVSGAPFEKSGDCDNFYQCSNGYLHTKPCAPGTVFNPAIGVCDWPYNVPGCGSSGGGGGGGAEVTPGPSTSGPPPSSCDALCVDSSGNPQSGNPFEIPGDCDHFYQCSNCYLHIMPCAPGTAFNPVIGVCDWPYNVPGCGGSGGGSSEGSTSGSGATPLPTTEAPAPPSFDDDCVDWSGNPTSGNPFEKPGDCDNFYQCSNGYLHTMPCAPGTAFNPAIGVCDWPYNVPGCGGSTGNPTPPAINQPCYNATGYPISGDPYEKPGDCEHFYQCSNGVQHTMPCASGTVFNPALGGCDWPYNVPGCDGTGGGSSGGSGGTPAPTTAAPTPPKYDAECLGATGYPISTGPFEKPNDCDNFYQCSNGYLHIMPCAPGTVFNPALSVCDWPYNVPGCGTTGGESSGGSGGPPPPTTAAPAPPKYDSECLDANGYPISTGPFEKPNDCDNFYQCSNGYLHIMPCAPGTAFNPAIGVCDWPYNVPGCNPSGGGGNGGVEVTPGPSTSVPTPPPFDAECLNATGYPISTGPFVKPHDCDNFYQCSNGYLHIMPCAPGTVFNPAIGVCDWPYNVPGCGATTTTTEKVTTTTKVTPSPYDPECLDATGYPISSAPFEKPGDCDHFYQCSNGYLHVMPCAPGTVFNPDPAVGVCDWPYNVPGCGGTTTTTEKVTTTTKATPAPCDSLCVDSSGNPLSGNPFEKPGDCDHFYQCSNCYLHTMPCAPGTVFNPAIGVCDHPYNVPGCGGTTTTTEKVTTTTKATPKPFDRDCVDATGKPISGNPFEKPGDCDNFYQCSNGYRYEMPCAPGTAFNPAIGVCDHPYNVPGCGTKGPSCTGSNGEPLSTPPFEKPGDCTHFYQCGAGILYTMECAPGTAFNPKLSVCDWPYNVPGC